jgi:glycosyltransferase involved in cell wall biosynthesis
VNKIPFLRNIFFKATFIRTLVLKCIVRLVPITYTNFIEVYRENMKRELHSSSNMRISCVVTFNNIERLEYLREALGSIYSQNYEKIQVIIVDGTGISRDKLLEIGEEFDERFFFKKFVSKYPSQARNAFLEELKGDIIVFLDDDNVFLPGYFFNLANWHLHNEHIDVGIFRFLLFRKKELVDLPISRRFTNKNLSRRNLSDTSAISFKARVVQKNLWPNVEKHEDWVLLKNCLTSGHRIKVENSFCMLYRIHENNRSSPKTNNKLLKR